VTYLDSLTVPRMDLPMTRLMTTTNYHRQGVSVGDTRRSVIGLVEGFVDGLVLGPAVGRFRQRHTTAAGDSDLRWRVDFGGARLVIGCTHRSWTLRVDFFGARTRV
jgi:hypothetical protein